jgi:hypothetical protein
VRGGGGEGAVHLDGIFLRAPTEFCWRGSFAGATYISKTAPAKFKMRQQNFKLQTCQQNH